MAQKIQKQKKSKADAFSFYEEALRLISDSKASAAQKILLKVKKNFPGETELLARVQVLLRVCESRQRKAKATALNAPEEIFQQGAFHHNEGKYQEALRYFKKAQSKSSTKLDYVRYGVAATEAIQGNGKNAIKALQEAIRLNPANKFFALNDPDFESLAKNKSFQKLTQASK